MECRNPLFREIHKNTWLKRVTADNRKIPVGTKKPERYWVVFCVHDDCEAHLEGYLEPRLASTHSPEWSVSLQSTLHISHTLVPSEQEYEFVITLLGDTVRFHASSWEIMQEWIDTLRLKLREMKILSPNENLYSKLPEVRPPLLPTRDPMSPLPATPPVPAAIVPGVERVVTSTSQNSRQMSTVSAPTESPAETNNDPVSAQPAASAATSTASTSIPSTSMSNTLTQNLIKMLSDPVLTYNDQVNSTYGTESEASFDASAANDVDESTSGTELPEQCANVTTKVENVQSLATTFVNNVLADPNTCGASTSGLSSYVSSAKRDTHTTDIDNESSSLDSIASSVCPTPEPIVIPRPQTIRKEKSTAKEKSVENEASKTATDEGGATTNITIIQVSSPITNDEFKFDERNDVDDDKYKSNVQIIPSNFTEKMPSQSNEEVPKVTTVQVTSAVVSVTASTTVVPSETMPRSTIEPVSGSIKPLTSNVHVTNVPVGIASATARPVATPLHYEQVFVMASSAAANSNQNEMAATPRNAVSHNQQKSTSQIEIHVNRIKLQKTEVPSLPHASNETPSTSTASVITLPPPSSAASSNAIANANKPKIQLEPKRRPLLTRGLTEAVILRSSRKDQSTNRSNAKETTSHASAVQTLRNESSEQRKRSSSTSDTQGVRNRVAATASNNNATSTANAGNSVNSNNNIVTSNDPRRIQTPPQPFRPPHVELSLHASGRLTMREQQVMQLRREMMHPGGVRLQLRRKDCVNSIAFVDAFGAIWISGWKQKEHPMLYNALHIGDQLISIGGVAVHNSNEAHKMIRNSPGLYIEFIIRRIPFGRVYAIRREIERQCLGLIRDGNTATIVDVVPNSLSARHGLPPKAQACDGLSLTFWVLTEINGRPLNLFFKDNEVRDRLNAVGRDISILVQPSDLIAKLKKQLKSIRSYKEYIVQ